MTESIILSVIALVGLLVFAITSIILIVIVLQKEPTYFKFWTTQGHFEIKFDSKVDESP